MEFFKGLGLWTNMAMFAAAAVVVWIAGTRITHYADAISRMTGLGHAVLGVLLLGGITSLPELAVTVSASASGNPALAVNNILGGVAMQVAILAAADFAIGRRALTSVVPDSTVLLQGTLCIVLLSLAAAGTVTGDYAVLGIGIWLWLVFAVFLYGMAMIARSEDKQPWIAGQSVQAVPAAGRGSSRSGARHGEREGRQDRDGAEPRERGGQDGPLSAVVWRMVIAGGAILVAGFLLSTTGEAIAEQTGIGSSFVGAVLVAVATSLPEVSTTLAAARAGLYTMAISDIFGTNLFDVALLFVADAVGGARPVLGEVGAFSTFGALLGILVTALFLAGLAERRDRTIARMGIDSISVLAAYLGGLAVLYQLR